MAMPRDKVIAYCLSKPGAEETFPWGDGELVVKVGGKAFAFIGLGDGPGSVGVKCGRDADDAAAWRERHPGAVAASAYIGRYGWNRVALEAGVPDDDILELIDGSYDDVASRLPKARRPEAV
jgi:predicted DNA-binding protein (MmcQ/YjbR family)